MQSTNAARFFPDEGMITVPIMIDSVKKAKDMDMARCIYFSVESVYPFPGVVERTSEAVRHTIPHAGLDFIFRPSLHMLVTGLEGVLVGPYVGTIEKLSLTEPGIFHSPEEIDRTLDVIENELGLVFESRSFWMPKSLFRRVSHNTVYRIRDDLFSLALSYNAELVSEKEFKKECRAREGEVEVSRKDTKAFRQWSRQQIAIAKEQYPKNSRHALGLPDKWKKR